MGGCCCCASNGQGFNNPAPVYHYPRAPEVRQPLSSHHGTGAAVSPALLVDTNLDTSIPVTFRAPPVPVPFETYIGNAQTTHSDQASCGDKNEAVQLVEKSVADTNSLSTEETAIKVVEVDGNANSNVELTAAKEVEDDLEKPADLKKAGDTLVTSLLEEEEDVCPTCLEEYDKENPKIITKCEHHFHLACMLEWMERSDTCPVCNKEMVFSTSGDF